MKQPPVHLIISTHTTRHLERTLIGAAAQSLPPASVTVSCDTDDPAIADLVRRFADRRGLAITLIQRAHTGKSRSSQVRNNAVRVLVASGAAPESLLVFLDGDCVPAPDLLALHARICAARHVAIGFRVDLTPEQTEAFDESALATGHSPIAPAPQQLVELRHRTARYRRQAWLRQLGIAKPHKPKLLSANFAVRLTDYLAVNGFDEEYEGYGQEDDDLGRRLYRHGCRPIIAIDRALTFHQHHPTRAPGDWHTSPNADRFKAGGPTRCIHGVENPLPQPAVSVVHANSCPVPVKA
jgi:hypothetical protein